MRIGIDAKWYFNGHPSGKRITENLVSVLLKSNLKHEIILYLDCRYKNVQIQNNNPKIQFVYIWSGNNLLSNIFVLPFYAYRNRVDILISFNFSPLAGTYKRITWILDAIFKSHPEYFTFKERLYFSWIKPLALMADHICTISFSEKKRMLQYGFSTLDKKIDVIHLGIEEKFKVKKKHNLDYLIKVQNKYHLPERFLLYVGRLNQRKNLHNLLRAFALLPSKDIPLVLAGSPDWKMFDIKNTLAELNLTGHVICTGFVEDDDLPALYSLATLFCYVSYEEGFGLPPLESMASGVPVVVSNTSSLPEVCGDAAEYVNPYEPADIARGITKLITDESRYRYLVEIGLRRTLEFQWENTTKELINLAVRVDRS